jgi:hypothetical protein
MFSHARRMIFDALPANNKNSARQPISSAMNASRSSPRYTWTRKPAPLPLSFDRAFKEDAYRRDVALLALSCATGLHISA